MKKARNIVEDENLRRDIVEKIAGSKAVKKMKKELAYLVLYGSYAKGRQGPLFSPA